MIIPYQQLSPETLNNLLESYVLQEGTDYGEQEKTLAEKVADVKNSLTRGDIVLVFSELHETVNLIPKVEFEAQQAQNQAYPDQQY